MNIDDEIRPRFPDTAEALAILSSGWELTHGKSLKERQHELDRAVVNVDAKLPE